MTTGSRSCKERERMKIPRTRGGHGQQLVAISFAANGCRRAGAEVTTSPLFLKTLMLPLESEHVSGGCL